jgi:serine/threonine protein kinase
MAIFFFKQIANVFFELNAKKIIHRNLSPTNIFISNDYKVKVGHYMNLSIGSDYDIFQKDLGKIPIRRLR